MKVTERLSRLKLAPNTAGKYKTLKRNVRFADGTGLKQGASVRVLDVGMFFVKVQIPAMSFAVGRLSHSSIKW